MSDRLFAKLAATMAEETTAEGRRKRVFGQAAWLAREVAKGKNQLGYQQAADKVILFACGDGLLDQATAEKSFAAGWAVGQQADSSKPAPAAAASAPPPSRALSVLRDPAVRQELKAIIREVLSAQGGAA